MNRNAEMIQMNAQGSTLQAIGDKYKLTRQRVSQILAKQGVIAQKRREQLATARKEAFIKDVCRLMRKGMNLRNIATKLGVRPAQVYELNLPDEAYFQKDVASLLDRMEMGEHWIWTGAVNPKSGHPCASRRRISKSNRVQVIVYTAMYGTPTGEVRVQCGIKTCCKPEHLVDIVVPKSILKK